MSDSQGPGQREVAYRLFAAEFDDSDRSYSESDEERAPNYVVTPTGARVNRLFVVGVLTEVEGVSEDVLRARVVDPTGAFVLYAGQYQPDEQAFLERAEPPTFVAVTGKARTFQPEDSDRVLTSVRPETISEVDAETRDRWTVGAAEQTLDRVARMAAAKRLDARGDALEATLRERALPEGLAEGIPLALDHYGTTGEYLGAVRQMALEAVRLVAGEIEEVESLALVPGEGTEASLDDLAGTHLAAPAERVSGTEVDEADAPTSESEPTTDATDVATPGSGAGAEPDEADETGTEDDLGDFDPAEFELDEEEREEIESEFGTDFQSGTEVEEPGAADIETPEPDSAEEPADGDDTMTEEATAEDGAAEPADVVDAVVDVMTELDDGDGADRDAVVDAMSEQYGISPDETTEALQEALMDGRCYEPDDATLKPI